MQKTISFSEEEIDDPIETLMREGFSEHARSTGNSDGGIEEVSLLAKEGESVIGAVCGKLFYGGLHIKNLFIVPENRGAGIGRKLVEALIEKGKEKGARFAYVETLSFQGKEFYQKLGFIEEFFRPGYEGGVTFHYLRKDFEESGSKGATPSEELERLKSAFNVFLNASSDGYWEWYLQEDYEYMSSRFWEILGYDHRTKKHSASEWQDLIFKEDLNLALDNLKKHVATKGKHPYSQEVRYKHKNGSTVTVLCRGTVVEWDENGEPLRMVGTHTDITRLKKNEELLLAKQKAFERKNQELEQFIYIASHDLQAPLRHITSYMDLLLEELGNHPPENVKNFASTIKRSSKKMKQLLDHLLSLSRVREEYQQVESLSLESLVKEVIENLKDQFPSIQQSVHCNALPVVMGDRKMIKRLFSHLLENAMTFSREGVEPKIVIHSEKQNGDFLFKIVDNGKGFNKADKKKIFNVFVRLYGSNNSESSGIGLALCKKIVELHGGEIWAGVNETYGSTLHFTLPLSERT